MKTLVAINNLTVVDQMAYANHCQLWFRLGVMKGRRNIEGQEVEFALCNPKRMTIDRMRNEAAKIAIEGDFDYLWFIDDDVLVPFDAFVKLQARDKDIIAGVTHIRGYPFYPMIFNFSDEKYKENTYVVDYKTTCDSSGLLKCDAVGFSCCLIKVSLLKKVIPPFFITSCAPSYNQTEDVFFCRRAKEQNPDLEVYVDTTIHTAHILGSDVIEPSTVEFWKTLEESRSPQLKEVIEREEKKGRLDRTPEQTENVLKEVYAI